METIVLEIHNTPWGEHFCYVMGKADNLHPFKDWRRHTGEKVFHVSPFIDMDIRYDWRFRLPGDTLGVHIIDYQKDSKLFDATLALRRRSLHRRALTRLLLIYPAMTIKVVTLIYWQALKTDPEKNPFLYPSEKRRMTLGKDIHMTDFIIPAEAPHLDELKTGKLDRFARLTVLSVMKKLKFGRIRIIEDPDQHSVWWRQSLGIAGQHSRPSPKFL